MSLRDLEDGAVAYQVKAGALHGQSRPMMSDARIKSGCSSDPASGLALLFEPQARPTADDIAALIATSAAVSRAMSISHRPSTDEGWLEVLCRGMIFDVAGLAPGPAEALPAIQHKGGFEADFPDLAVEAVTVRVGQHLAGGVNLLPVRSAHAEVARALMSLAGFRMAVWCSADIAIGPQHFERGVAARLEGGAFPVSG